MGHNSTATSGSSFVSAFALTPHTMRPPSVLANPEIALARLALSSLFRPASRRLLFCLKSRYSPPPHGSQRSCESRPVSVLAPSNPSPRCPQAAQDSSPQVTSARFRLPPYRARASPYLCYPCMPRKPFSTLLQTAETSPIHNADSSNAMPISLGAEGDRQLSWAGSQHRAVRLSAHPGIWATAPRESP